MNVLIYDPVPHRLHKAANALGEAYSVTPVQTPAEVKDVPLYDVVILDEEIDLRWLEHAIRNCPNTVFLIGMENKSVATIRRFTDIGALDGINYPIERRTFERILPPGLKDGLPEVSQPVSPASSYVAPAKEETQVPDPTPQSTETVVEQRQPVQRRSLPWENESTMPEKQPVRSQTQFERTKEKPLKKEARRLRDKGPDIEGLQIFDEDEIHDSSFAPTRQEIVAITSARGGVGKSTIAYNLAVLASEKGIRTVLIDVDPRGNLVSISNTKYRYTADQWDKIDPENDGEKTVMNLLAQMDCGAFLLPSGRKVNGMTSETLEKVILLLRRYFQLIIIDCEPRFTPTTLMAYQTANNIVVVTPDDITAFGRTIEKVNQMRDELEVEADKIKLIVNRVEDFDKDAEEILVRKSHCKVIAKIPNASDLRKLQKQGHPAVSNRKSGFTKQMKILLSRVILVPQQSSSNSKSGNGWFSKIFKKSS